MKEFKLPDSITEVKEINPTDLVIISVPKTGKSTILAELTKQKNGIIFNLEKNGTDYLSSRCINIYDDSITSFDEAMEVYKGYRTQLLKEKGKYDYLIVDSLTALDEMSNLMGTYYYMHSVPQGKNFNRDPKNGETYKFGDDRFKMVTELGEGYGYKHTRKWFLDQMGIFNEIAPYRIYTGHVKDTLIRNDQNEEVTGKEINLTGKLKSLLAVKVSTLCKLIADGDKRYLSFEVDNDNIIAGSRVPHLQGQILISEKVDGKIITHWDKIFK
jgi:hypothetical protein